MELLSQCRSLSLLTRDVGTKGSTNQGSQSRSRRELIHHIPPLWLTSSHRPWLERVPRPAAAFSKHRLADCVAVGSWRPGECAASFHGLLLAVKE